MYKDLMTNQKTSAVRFEYEYSGAYNTSDTKLALLDADEVDGLIKSIQILQEKMIASTPVNYTEVEYFSRSGFQAGGFYEQKKKAWSAFVKLEKYDSKSYVFIDNDDLTQLLTLMVLAQLC
jgi:predicted hydrolase (HD superfamily)